MRYSFLFLLLFLFSCDKENSCKNCVKTDATIIWSGPLEADGCNWLVKIGTIYYHPDVLGDAFKQTDLAVKICYKETGDQFHCGLAGAGIPVIHVVDMKK
ncbi:MAG: hypothetical protein WDN26_17450 [Chitinophagaceae bacterium]